MTKSNSYVFLQLPVITDLRNPCMKPEHWKTLESIVGTSLNAELTVAVLEELNIFSHGMEIQEVTHKYIQIMSFSCFSCVALVTADD